MCHEWKEIVALMCGAGMIIIGNVYDAISSPHERQHGAQQLNRILEKGFRKFPTFIAQRRFSEQYLFAQMAALMVSSFILLQIVKLLLR